MQEARLAAKRVQEFIRVFIIDKQSDLNNPALRKQIELDLAAGIQVYVCRASDISAKVKELDFGVWDDDYVCTVRSNNTGKVEEVELNSRQKDIKTALQWKTEILRHSMLIKNLRDFENYRKEDH